MSDVRFWAKRYKDEGWSPIPIPRGEKGPRISGWEQKTFEPADFAEDDNIGVHLGLTGLYDVDLDDKLAAIAADILLPTTARVSGRPGKPRSHRFFTSDDRLEHVAYHGLGGNNDTIVELRGWSKSGAPTQTMIPPSLHPSGETTAWDSDQKPFHAASTEQTLAWKTGVRNVAAAVLIARAFPGPGHRHGPRLALAGYLHRVGLDDLEVLQIGKAVMVLIGGDVQDWLDTARTTLAKLKADKDSAVTGGPTLVQALADGAAVMKRLNAWFGRTDQAAVESVIDRLNKDYFIVEAGTDVWIADTTDIDSVIKLWPFTNFKKKFCKDFMPAHETAEGKRKRGRPVVDVWIEHPDGRKHNQLVYAPPGSKLALKPGDYNGWKGFACEPQPGPHPRLSDHLATVICDGDTQLYSWLLNWCAALVQRPGEHAMTALVLQGGQGTGKGFFAHDVLGKLFDRRHYVAISMREQVYGRFNDVLSGRCLVFLDEATWGGSKEDAGKLKGLITGDDLMIERKHGAVLPERSMMHLIFASNEDWPVGIDRDDRRFAAFKITRVAHQNSPGYFKPLYDELSNGGRAAFLAAMLAWTIDEDLLRKPPQTQGKDELKHRSMPPEAEWWFERLQEGRVFVNDKVWTTRVPRAAVYAAYVEWAQNLGISRRLSSGQLGIALRKLCASLDTVRSGPSKPREYLLPSLRQARVDFSTFMGTTETWDDVAVGPLVPDDEPF